VSLINILLSLENGVNGHSKDEGQESADKQCPIKVL